MTGDQLKPEEASPAVAQTHVQSESNIRQSCAGCFARLSLILRSILGLAIGVFVAYIIYIYFLFLHPSRTIAHIPAGMVNILFFAVFVLPALASLRKDVGRAFASDWTPEGSIHWVRVAILAMIAGLAYCGLTFGVRPSYIFVYHPTTSDAIVHSVKVGKDALSRFTMYDFTDTRFTVAKMDVEGDDTVTVTSAKGILARVIWPKQAGKAFNPFYRHARIDLQPYFDVGVEVTVIDQVEVRVSDEFELTRGNAKELPSKFPPRLRESTLAWKMTKPVSVEKLRRKARSVKMSVAGEEAPVVAEESVVTFDLDPNVGLEEQCNGKIWEAFGDRAICASVLMQATEDIAIDIYEVGSKMHGEFTRKAECVYYSYEYAMRDRVEGEGRNRHSVGASAILGGGV